MYVLVYINLFHFINVIRYFYILCTMLERRAHREICLQLLRTLCSLETRCYLILIFQLVLYISLSASLMINDKSLQHVRNMILSGVNSLNTSLQR